MFSENVFREKKQFFIKKCVCFSKKQPTKVKFNRNVFRTKKLRKYQPLVRSPWVLQQAEQAKVGPGPAEVYCLLERFR